MFEFPADAQNLVLVWEKAGVKEGGLLGAQPGTHILNITADGNWTVSIEQ